VNSVNAGEYIYIMADLYLRFNLRVVVGDDEMQTCI